ncbi:MAG: aminoacyl-tRNA hydrolase [Firmicutes bacterium]|nr:aminoacyl-tRNA hydrolase [Bacillota bacterium]
MYIICGLGNPGKEYECTRHNMGFLTVDVLSERLGISVNRLKFRALVGEGFVGTEKVVLVKPQTFMNLSGESLREVVAFYKPEHDHLLLIYDDIDLAPGTVRIRPHGSAGTHNGMRSVIYQLQFSDFPRIRIGVGSSGVIPLQKYVIGRWTEEERPLLADAVSRAAAAAEMYVKSGLNSAMNEYNRKTAE